MHQLRRRAFVFAMVIVGFGFYGLWSSCWGKSCWGPNTHNLYEADIIGMIFHSLFFLVPSPDGLNSTLLHKHWALYVALFLSPLFTVSVLLELLRTFASENFARLRLKFWRGHIVIFGGGMRASALIQACLEKGEKALMRGSHFQTLKRILSPDFFEKRHKIKDHARL